MTKKTRKRISVSLSEDEFKELQTKSEKEYLNPTSYTKKLIDIALTSKTDNKEQSHDVARNRVWIDLSDVELKKLEKSSNKECLKKSTFVKNILLQTLNSKLFVTNDIELELKQLRYLLSNMANNINQMAHHSNTIKRVVDEDQVLLAFLRIEETVNGFIEYKIKEGG